MASPTGSMNPETLITLKVTHGDNTRKIKLPIKDLNAVELTDKLRYTLNIPKGKKVILERFSDSAGGYIVLDKTNVPVYKALVRAAKAKGKLRLKITVDEEKATQDNMPAAPVFTPAKPVVPAPAIPANLMCVKPRMSGAGIFEYRSSLYNASAAPKEAPKEAPVPIAFEEIKTPAATVTAPAAAPTPESQGLAFRTRAVTTIQNHAQAAWSVYCNACDVSMADVHYHCSICDGGDYDLCETCVNSGALCQDPDHWLIKRFIRDNKVVTSVTERISRKLQEEAPEVKSMPGDFATADEPATSQIALSAPTRTCNNCVVVLQERDFVTCQDCDDFDLCINCHTNNLHGHSAKHTFQPATTDTKLPIFAQSLLKAGRNVAHNAICDECNKKIFGIRHKCLNCPDWDLCGECYVNAGKTHPRHRFAPVYEQLADPLPNKSRHFGIYCDGPLCHATKSQSYIVGDRYKCAVCHDLDFCANCEASPANVHNRTHPLIKFRTAVRNVNITTINEDKNGNVRDMGDRRPQSAVAPVQPVNTATAVQTVAEIPPSEEKTIIQHVVQPRDVDIPSSPVAPVTTTYNQSAVVTPAMLTAAFVRDSVPDGSIMAAGAVFTQVWTLRNEGPFVWPAGCSVRFVGGDNMLNVDNFHPASVSDIAKATESSVVAREVQVGEEISFRITLRAPTRLGKSISYWRLKAADGTPFGHRLWCDIEVRDSATPEQGEKVINAPVQPSFAPTFGYKEAADRILQSRVQAMRETQLRLLQHQRMLQHTQLEGDRRVVSAPVPSSQVPSMPAAYNNAPPVSEAKLEAEKARKEAAKARVEAIKAKIMRYRAENEKIQIKRRTSAAEESPISRNAVPIKTEELVEEPKIADVAPVKEEEAELAASSTNSSQMVFPKLEKESPASSSIISAKPAYVQAEDGEVEHSAAMPANAEHEEEPVTSPVDGDFDDLEVVSAGIVSDEEDGDDGFLTDEEYDILDASDRETVASP